MTGNGIIQLKSNGQPTYPQPPSAQAQQQQYIKQQQKQPAPGAFLVKDNNFRLQPGMNPAQMAGHPYPIPRPQVAAVPPDLRGQPKVKDYDMRKVNPTENQAREQLSSYVVKRIVKREDQNDFNDGMMRDKSTWENARHYDADDISQREAARKVLNLNKGGVTSLTDKKNSLGRNCQWQVERALDDLRDAETDARFETNLVQLECTVRDKNGVETRDDMSMAKTQKSKKDKSSKSKNRSSSKHHTRNKSSKGGERVSVTAYYKRTPGPGVDVIEMMKEMEFGAQAPYRPQIPPNGYPIQPIGGGLPPFNNGVNGFPPPPPPPPVNHGPGPFGGVPPPPPPPPGFPGDRGPRNGNNGPGPGRGRTPNPGDRGPRNGSPGPRRGRTPNPGDRGPSPSPSSRSSVSTDSWSDGRSSAMTPPSSIGSGSRRGRSAHYKGHDRGRPRYRSQHFHMEPARTHTKAERPSRLYAAGPPPPIPSSPQHPAIHQLPPQPLRRERLETYQDQSDRWDRRPLRVQVIQERSLSDYSQEELEDQLDRLRLEDGRGRQEDYRLFENSSYRRGDDEYYGRTSPRRRLASPYEDEYTTPGLRFRTERRVPEYRVFRGNPFERRI